MKVKTDVKAGYGQGCGCGANGKSKVHNRLWTGRHTS